MIRRRSKTRRDGRRLNVPFGPILLLVLVITLIEVVHVLTVEESVYAQDAAAMDIAAAAYGSGEGGGVPGTLIRAVEYDIRIVAIYGPRSVRVGEEANYRVRLADGTKRPVIYRWNLGDGTLAEGNNVTHRFMKPGKYRLQATVQNRTGSDTQAIEVVVTGNVIIPVPAVDEETPVAEASPRERTVSTTPEPAVSPRESAFHGSQPLSWDGSRFTLIVATSSDRKDAERVAVDLRRRGLRSGIYLDDTGFGTPVYRIVVGDFANEQAAVRGREALLQSGYGGAFIVHPMPQR